MTAPRPKKPRRRLRRLGMAASAVLIVLGALYGKSAYLIARAWVHDRPVPDDVPAGFADDASRLNRTAVREVWDVPADPAEAERQLAALLGRARADGLKVSIAGARHSMGGHTISPDGIVVNMLPFDRTKVDADSGTGDATSARMSAEALSMDGNCAFCPAAAKVSAFASPVTVTRTASNGRTSMWSPAL